MSDAPADDLARLAAALENPNAFRGGADDLLRGLRIGPAQLAALTLAPKAERRAGLATMLAVPGEMKQPPAIKMTSPATAAAVASTMAPIVDHRLPKWRVDHLRRHRSA
jgi:hypothetical protein